MNCHPAIESWEDHAGTDLELIRAWWRHRPHTVLLATGWRFDVVEVPAALGLRALGAARLRGFDPAGPVLATPSGRWMFLVRPGLPLRAELRHRLDVVRHGRGSWIPAAPSRMPEGAVRWAVSPEQAQWSLPTSASVQAMLIDALGSPGLGSLGHHPVVAVPRQMSTTRRAA
jgi:Bifunctional DNA primase/polymerase, N-terminal